MNDKDCYQCKKVFAKPKKYSKTQWIKSLFCSRHCFAQKRTEVPRTDEVKKKLSIAHKGTKKPWAGKYKHTKEHNKHIGESSKGNKYALGYRHSEESKKKISERMKGEKNYRWKGGNKTFRKRKNFYESQRKTKKRCNGGKHTYDEWELLKKQYNYTCPCCHKKEPEIKLTEDHIIPVSKGGLNNIENIQPLCQSCNSKKHDKTIKYGISGGEENYSAK